MKDAMTSSLPDYASALEAALAIITPIESQSVHLTDASNRILQQSIETDRDQPPFNRAMMDGYAVRAADIMLGTKLKVVDTIAAGQAWDGRTIQPSECVKIATGAAVPSGLDAVIQHELSNRSNPVEFELDHIEIGRAIHPKGADARAGKTILQPGCCLTPACIGILATLGITTVRVAKRPNIVILTSGDEVLDVTVTQLQDHQIRNSNGPMLKAALSRMGAGHVEHWHLADDRSFTITTVREQLQRDDVDVLITVGGISAGERDYFHDAFAASDITFAVRRAAIQPGKPIHIGRCSTGTIVAGLPGNPVSALATAHLFLWPMLRKLTGMSHASLPWQLRTLHGSVQPNARREAFRPCSVVSANEVLIPSWQGSGDLIHAGPTDGLVALPRQAEVVEEGSNVMFLPWA